MGQELSYQCAQHHSHRTIDDVRSCNEYHNNRGGDRHVENMTDKIIQAHERGAIDSTVAQAALKSSSFGERRALQQ